MTIPLRTLASTRHPRDEHSASLLESNNEKHGSRRSSDSAGSDFSLWSDTGDLAEQLANEEDPLRIDIRGSFDHEAPGNSRSRPRGRPARRVHYSQQDHLHRKDTNSGINKEAIHIPEPTARRISQAEKVIATIMTGDRQASHMHGLTGKPLLYDMATLVGHRELLI